MENAQKAIIIGVGLFITIILIAAIMSITNIGQNLLNQGQSQLTSLSTQLRSQLQGGYDQILMTDQRVMDTIVKYYTEKGVAIYLYPIIRNETRTPVCMTKVDGDFITLNNGIDTSEIIVRNSIISEIPDGDRIKLGDFSDSTKTDTYINPYGKYKSVLIKDADSTRVIGVAILRYQ